MFAVIATVLCLTAVSHSAPQACHDLVRSFDQLDPQQLEGTWALVAGSLKDPTSADVLKGRDSVTIEFHNSTYTQANRAADACQYYTHNILMDGHILYLQVKTFNFTGTFLRTSCPDCVLLTWEVESPNYKSEEFYLFSRRQEVDQKEMEEFRAQVKCLDMPPPIVMDPTKELCPTQTAGDPAAQTEEKTEEQKN